MDLLERYLAAVRRNLPARQADDIVAELREELLDRAEAEEARTGGVDWDALLNGFGHPLSVASRYRKHQSLIGPELFPFYLYSLKLFGGLTAFGVTISALIKASMHQGQPGQLIVQILGSFWWATAVVVGTTTIIFALVERYGGLDRHFRTWKPDALPELDLDRQPGRWESAIEIVAGIAVLLWWTGVVPWPFPTGSSAFRLELAPVWTQLYWPILALIAARLMYNLIQWLRPRWRWLGGIFAILTSIGAVVIALLLYRAGHWATVVPLTMSAQEAAGLETSLDLAARIAIMVTGAIWAWQGAQEARRWLRGVPR